MSVTPSNMLDLKTNAPDFSLPDLNGKNISLNDFEQARALLVVFMCNHCPYVKHIIKGFVKLAGEYLPKGIAIVGINSNDARAYPEDSPEKMQEFAADHGFPFPYLYDESQETAKKYKAACTPDFFIFDQNRELVYRGQMDDSRPGNEKPVTGKNLREAFDALLEGRSVPENQRPSTGCNIKWKS